MTRDQRGATADLTTGEHELDDVTGDDENENRDDGDDHGRVRRPERRTGPTNHSTSSGSCRLGCVTQPHALQRLLADGGLDALVVEAAPWARAFARVTPTAALVPALAIRGAPSALRSAIAIALAAPIAASFAWSPSDGPLLLVLLRDLFSGVPLAIALATPLWVAAHVGAIADQLRGAPEASIAPPPATEGARGPLAMLTALLASAAWIESGGTVRALLLLRGIAPETTVAPWAYAVRALADGIRVSLALAAGVLVASVALETALVAIGRAAAPIPVQPIAVVARPLVAVIALALSLQVAVLSLVGP